MSQMCARINSEDVSIAFFAQKCLRLQHQYGECLHFYPQCNATGGRWNPRALAQTDKRKHAGAKAWRQKGASTREQTTYALERTTFPRGVACRPSFGTAFRSRRKLPQPFHRTTQATPPNYPSTPQKHPSDSTE